MATRASVEIDRGRLAELTERETARLNDKTPGSAEMYERARQTLSGGVASSYQVREPWPIYLSHGKGPRVWDVDGNVMLDFHNGFGSMVQGHAHPAISKAVQERVELGTHFAAPTEDGVAVSEELARRWGLPKWRYVNSGSEATMDAIRIARAHTGRDTIVKIFGSYHGHHDYVMVSIGVPYDRIGDRDNLASLPYGGGIPESVVQMTVPVPFNDAGAMERTDRALDRRGPQAGLRHHGGGHDEPRGRAPRAGLPRGRSRADAKARHPPRLRRGEDGPLHRAGGRDGALRRDARHGDSRQGARRRPPLRGDRRHRGGHGGRRGRQGLPGRHVQRQPALMAAARASLYEVLTPEAYAHLDALNDHILKGCTAVIEKHALPGYAVGVGSKGCVTFSPKKIVDYETFKENQDAELSELVVALQHEPRHLHDPRPRGGVDAVGDAHASRTATATSRCSRRWRADLTE